MSFFKFNSLPYSQFPKLMIDSLLYQAYLELEKSQWSSPEEIEQLQIKQINALLQHAYNNCSYYTLIIEKSIKKPKISSLEEFRKIPILTRKDYQNHFNMIRSQKLPNGMIADEKPIYTSGTNGIPIQVYKTNIDHLWWMAFAMRDLNWNQMDPTKKAAAIKLIAMSPEEMPKALMGVSTPSWFPSDLFQSSECYAVDIRLDPKAQLNWLKYIKPNYLISLPSNLDVLANIIKEKNEKVNLDLIQIIGETLNDDVKINIESAFNAPVKNLYSSNEFGYMASSCPSGEGMHVHAENIFTEVLNEKDEPCKPGETGRLVATSLTNFTNPFIRYEILDYVTLAEKPCPCGRGLPFWKKVEGRMHPMLYLNNGSRKASTGLMLGIRQIGGIHQFQVIQKSKDLFIVKVVPNNEWTATHGNNIIKLIQNEVESDVKVEIQGHPNLEKPNGKLKIIEVEI